MATSRTKRFLRAVGVVPVVLVLVGASGLSLTLAAGTSAASTPSGNVFTGKIPGCVVKIVVGDTSATATVTGCADDARGSYYLSSWAATSGTYSPTMRQTLVDYRKSAPWTVKLATTGCFYQVDFAYRSSPPGTPAPQLLPVAAHLGELPSCLPVTTTTLPGSTTTLPGSTTTVPGSTTTVPGSTTTVPGSTTTVPGSTTTVPGSTTTVPGSTTTVPGSSTTTVPGSTTTVPGSTTTLPGSTTTQPPGDPSTSTTTAPPITTPVTDPPPTSNLPVLAAGSGDPSTTPTTWVQVLQPMSATVAAASSAPSGTLPFTGFVALTLLFVGTGLIGAGMAVVRGSRSGALAARALGS